jgi:hypothetical protein
MEYGQNPSIESPERKEQEFIEVKNKKCAAGER